MNNTSRFDNGQMPFARWVKAWSKRSEDLAHWSFTQLVNRTDAWGQYLAVEDRSPSRKAITRHGQLSQDQLIRHFRGERQGDLIGVHAISANGTSRWVAIDIDHHGQRDNQHHLRNRQAAITLYRRATDLRFDPLLLSSNGRGGYHLVVLFDTPAPSTTAYCFGRWLIRDWADLGLTKEPETFPKQSELTRKCRWGNWLRLPGRHHTFNYYTQVWSGSSWLSGEDAIDGILAAQGRRATNIPAEVFAYARPSLVAQPAAVKIASAEGLTADQTAGPLGRVLTRLANVQPTGGQWSARCPAHHDRNNSLSVARADNGNVLMYCHAGCGVEAVVDALGLRMSDLFAQHRPRRRTRRNRTHH